MKIALGADHAGFQMKNVIKEKLEKEGFETKDFGTFDESSVDYPDYAYYVGKSVVAGECECGIVVCGTGVGISIAANKVAGIRAGLCFNEFMAEATRQHNNANVLALGARVIDEEMALKIVDKFLNTPFEAGRHEKRVAKIKNIEEIIAVEQAEKLAAMVSSKE